jgi:predicted esterase
VQSQIIGSFIKQIDKQPMILVGHSYGGPMVAKLAADHPSWYKHVVIPLHRSKGRKPEQTHGREISSAA